MGDVFVVSKGEGLDVVFDFEENLRVGGDDLVGRASGGGDPRRFGSDGIWRVDFTEAGVPSSQTL